MALRDRIAGGIRALADAVGRPSFAGTPYPTGQVEAPKQETQELGGSGTFNFGGFIRGEDFNPEMDSLTALANLDVMRRSDAQVNAATQVIMQPIRSADKSVDPASPDPRDVAAARFVEWNLFSGERVVWDDFLRQALLMLVFGFYLFEKVWSLQEEGEWAGKLAIGRLAPRPPKTIWQWFTDEDGRLLSVKQLAVKAGTYQFLDIPSEKLVRFTYNQEGENFAGISILRSAYAHWKIKSNLYVVDAIRAVRYGCGIPRAKLAKGYNPTAADREALINTLMGMTSHQHSYILEPEQVTIDILVPSGTQGGAEVLRTINHHNEQITRNVLATFLDMGGRSMGGSNALGSSTMDFFSNAVNSVAEQIGDVVNRQIIKPLVDMNFEVDAYPKFRFSGIRQRDLKAIAEIVTALSSTGMSFADLETENTFRNLLDLPERAEPEDGGGGGTVPGGGPQAGGGGRPGAPGRPGTPSGNGHPAVSAAPGHATAASGAPGRTTAASPAPSGGPAASAAPAGGQAVAAPGRDGHLGPPQHAAAAEPVAEGAPATVVQPVAQPRVVVPANQYEQSARPAQEPTAGEAAATTAAVDHTELARTDAGGNVAARSHGWDGVAAVPEQPRTTDGMTQAISRGQPAFGAHMARSTTIASSGAADEEGHSSSVADSHGPPRPLAAASRPTAEAVPATTGTRTATSTAVTPGPARSTALADVPASTVPLTAQLGTTPRTRGSRTDPGRAPEAEDPSVTWRPPTPLEAQVLDLREMPRRLDTERRALRATLRAAREAQISRIASAVARRKPGERVADPMVKAMAAEVAAATRDVYKYGHATVVAELRKQLRGHGRRLADWDESQHPRGEHGRFGAGAGGHHDEEQHQWRARPAPYRGLKSAVRQNVGGLTPEKAAEVMNEVAAREGFPANSIQIKGAHEFSVGDNRLTSAGSYSPFSGRITLNPSSLRSERELRTVLSHEIEHDKFAKYGNQVDAEHGRLEAANQQRAAQGRPPLGEKEVATRYPNLAAWQQFTGHGLGTLEAQDGVTKYSSLYWQQVGREGTGFSGITAAHAGPDVKDILPSWHSSNFVKAVNETLAEVAAVREGGRASVAPLGKAFEPLRERMQGHYRERVVPQREAASARKAARHGGGTGG